MTTKTDKNDFQDKLLSSLRQESVPVSIYLVNGICLQGQIEGFDAYVVMLESNRIIQAVYKHAISTIVPSLQVAHERVTAPKVTIKKKAPIGLRLTSSPVLEASEY